MKAAFIRSFLVALILLLCGHGFNCELTITDGVNGDAEDRAVGPASKKESSIKILFDKLESSVGDKKPHRYMFSVLSDETMRLYIDDKLILSGKIIIDIGATSEDSPSQTNEETGSGESRVSDDGKQEMRKPEKPESCQALPFDIGQQQHQQCDRRSGNVTNSDQPHEKGKGSMPLETCRVVLGDGMKKITSVCQELDRPINLIGDEALREAATCIESSPHPLKSLVDFICAKEGYVSEAEFLINSEIMLGKLQQVYEQKIIRTWWKMITGFLLGSAICSTLASLMVRPFLAVLGFVVGVPMPGTIASYIHGKAQHPNPVVSLFFRCLETIGTHGYTDSELVAYGGWCGGLFGMWVASYF